MAVLGSAAIPVQADGNPPPLFKATYKLHSGGIEIATMEREMSRIADNHYAYLSITQTVGLVALLHKDHIVERSEWTTSNGIPRPLYYTYSRTRGKKNRNVEIRFDWENRRTLHKVRDRDLELPLPEGTLDKLLYQYAIMLNAAGNRFPVTYHIADGGKMKQYDFSRLGDEKVKTALGELQTLKLQSNPSVKDKQITIWCAPDQNYLPVKVEHKEDGTVTTAVLQTIEWQ